MKKGKTYLKNAFSIFSRLEMRILPGNIAFFFVLAMIPMVTLIVITASYAHISIESVISFVQRFIPEEASTIIIDAISGNKHEKDTEMSYENRRGRSRYN